MPDRPSVPRRRLDAVIHVSADDRVDLGDHLVSLGTELLLDDGPEDTNRYTGTAQVSSHLVIDCDSEITAESYQLALREWARETLRTHVRADHRAAALDPHEPF